MLYIESLIQLGHQGRDIFTEVFITVPKKSIQLHKLGRFYSQAGDRKK